MGLDKKIKFAKMFEEVEGMNQVKFGKAIKDFRKKEGLSQARLARILEVTEMTVRNWERNGMVPRQRIVRRRLREVTEIDLELKEGQVRLQEAVGGHRDFLDAWMTTGLDLTDERSDRLSVEYGKKEVIFRLKVR